MKPVTGELSSADVFRSREIAASNVVEILDQNVEGRDRINALGNYLIVCTLLADNKSVDTIRSACHEGLMSAGAEPSMARKTTDLITSDESLAYVSSLTYIDPARPPRGIRVDKIGNGKTRTWLDEGEFIAGILSRT